MKLPPFEQRVEQVLVKLLSQLLHVSTESAEEIVTRPRNKYLKGGKAFAILVRPELDGYQCGVQVAVPCPSCQEHNNKLEFCGGPVVARSTLEGIDRDLIPEEFHRDVGADPVVVFEWEW